MPTPLFVLVHSPLVGPVTWGPAAASLRTLGHNVIVPSLRSEDADSRPHWQQHAVQIARALAHVPPDRALYWVAHSGAGPRLPAYRHSVPHPAAGYCFVDAGLPDAGLSQLAMLRRDDQEFARALLDDLSQGGRFPQWTDADLRSEIPNNALRAQLVRELQPQGLRYFNEPLPVFAGWPDAPCRYLQFSASYDADAARARLLGWPTQHLPGAHFHMFNAPESVAAALREPPQPLH